MDIFIAIIEKIRNTSSRGGIFLRNNGNGNEMYVASVAQQLSNADKGSISEYIVRNRSENDVSLILAVSQAHEATTRTFLNQFIHRKYQQPDSNIETNSGVFVHYRTQLEQSARVKVTKLYQLNFDKDKGWIVMPDENKIQHLPHKILNNVGERNLLLYTLLYPDQPSEIEKYASLEVSFATQVKLLVTARDGDATGKGYIEQDISAETPHIKTLHINPNLTPHLREKLVEWYGGKDEITLRNDLNNYFTNYQTLQQSLDVFFSAGNRFGISNMTVVNKDHHLYTVVHYKEGVALWRLLLAFAPLSDDPDIFSRAVARSIMEHFDNGKKRYLPNPDEKVIRIMIAPAFRRNVLDQSNNFENNLDVETRWFAWDAPSVLFLISQQWTQSKADGFAQMFPQGTASGLHNLISSWFDIK